MRSVRRRYGVGLARELAGGLCAMLEQTLRTRHSMAALQAELDIPAALVERKSRGRKASGIWAIRISVAAGRDPHVTVEKHETAAAA